ncbi:hypothetical protein [Streptomyces sp. NPDC058757]|uniref:hypothetical protein n=1 Tax=Streptomyces sp. NPDC058757 TaxID=3346626 RepID=UPI0036A0D0C2
MTEPIAAEIRRAAAHHAAGMLNVALTEWPPRGHALGDTRSDAEEELLREEIAWIADELKARAVIGTRQPCAVCGLPYLVKANGFIGHHHGMDAAGFSTGRTCPGYNRRPNPSA